MSHTDEQLRSFEYKGRAAWKPEQIYLLVDAEMNDMNE
jgi:hypothetical protein